MTAQETRARNGSHEGERGDDAQEFLAFAVRILDVLQPLCSQEDLQRLSQRMWVVTFGRARIVAFAVVFAVGTSIVIAIMLALVHLGLSVNAPLAGLCTVVVGFASALGLSRHVMPRSWCRTPEAVGLLEARERFDAANLPDTGRSDGGAVLGGYITSVRKILRLKG